MSRPPAREIAARAVLAGASVLAFLAALEVALRLLGYAPRRYPSTARLISPGWTMLLDCFPSNPRGYFDIDLREPAARERYFHLAPRRFDAVAARAPWAVEFRYNTLRFREVEIPPRREGVRRVMVVGDSFTEGEGVKEPDTYPRVLEGLLNAGGAIRWEVFNCARRGADFPELFEIFQAALRFEPDVVVYGMVINDAERSPAFQARQSYLNDWIIDRRVLLTGPPPPPPSRLRPRLVDLVQDRLEARRVGRESTRWYLDMYGEDNREGWERTRQYMRQMNRALLAHGGRLLVASWPLLVDLHRYPFASVDEKVARFCLEAGIPRHDLLPALAGHQTRDLWVHPVDMHPNEVAHRLAAESLAPIVWKMGDELGR